MNASPSSSEPVKGEIYPVLLPDFELPGVRHFVSAWHATVGQRVTAGDRLVEVTAGDVTVDLPAPFSGVLVERCAGTDEPLAAGHVLGRIQVR